MREKKLCLLATGGTIACVQGADGLRPALSGEALLQAVPELAAYGDIKVSELFALDSSNLLPAHWQQMARAIVERYDDFDGFVLTHGTDTMGYTAGALYYMLRGLGKPVVLTGSMLPLQAAGTDAKANLRGAFAIASSGRAGVYQAFAGRIIAGNAVKKVDSTARDAFRSIGRPQLGTFDGESGALSWQMAGDQATADTSAAEEIRRAANAPVREEAAAKSLRRAPFAPQTALDERVAVLKLVPGTPPRLLTLLADAGARAVIIEGYGAGGVPTAASPRDFLPAIDALRARGIRVLCATQCTTGGVHLDTYEMGVLAARHGAESADDLPIEALVPKTMIELGRAGEGKP